MFGLYDDLGFTEKEQLYSKVSHARMLEFVRSKSARVVSSIRSHNNYGEFRFITILVPRVKYGKGRKEAITFYGNGYHEYRDITSSFWSINVGNGCLYTDKPSLNKRQVIKEVEQERKEFIFDDAPKDNMFTLIADLTDEDGAYTELFQ